MDMAWGTRVRRNEMFVRCKSADSFVSQSAVEQPTAKERLLTGKQTVEQTNSCTNDGHARMKTKTCLVLFSQNVRITIFRAFLNFQFMHLSLPINKFGWGESVH
jgi:hypothetical protein